MTRILMNESGKDLKKKFTSEIASHQIEQDTEKENIENERRKLL